MDKYVSALNRRLGRQIVFVAPVGQAVVTLRKKIIAGEIAVIKKQSELFTDKLGHPQPPIEALAAYCYFSIIYRRTAVGLPIPDALSGAADPKWRSETLNRQLQEIAWAEVRHHPLSGFSHETSER